MLGLPLTLLSPPPPRSSIDIWGWHSPQESSCLSFCWGPCAWDHQQPPALHFTGHGKLPLIWNTWWSQDFSSHQQVPTGPVRAQCRWTPKRSGWRWQSLTSKKFGSEGDRALWSFPLPPASSSTPGIVKPHPPQGWALVKIQAMPRKMLALPLELPVWSVLVLMVATFLQVRRQESARDSEADRAESDSWPLLGHLGLKLQLLAFSVT